MLKTLTLRSYLSQGLETRFFDTEASKRRLPPLLPEKEPQNREAKEFRNV